MVLIKALVTATTLIASTIGSPSPKYPKPVSNITDFVETQLLEDPSPYDFPILQNGSLADSGQFPMPLCNGFKLEEASIDQLQSALSNGTLTSVQIVMCYLERIYQTDEYIR